jgi:hypothetical protein
MDLAAHQLEADVHRYGAGQAVDFALTEMPCCRKRTRCHAGDVRLRQ